MFENIIGNDKIKKILINSIKTNKVSHSYMFVGIEGIGKKLIAKEFAKMILCLNEDKYCNKCKSCIEFDSNNNPDFFLIEPEGNSIKIEQIREIQKKVAENPIISNKKVYIINDSDKMTKEAQNCLLKTLEEPPEYITIILIGQNENSFLETIKSRCMILHFDKIENEVIKSFLKDNFQIEDLDEDLLDTFQGSIGKAINLKDKENIYVKLKEVLNFAKKCSIIEFMKKAQIIYENKENIYEVLENINLILFKNIEQDIKYANCIQIVEETKKRLNSNSNFDMCIDNMILNIWEELN